MSIFAYLMAVLLPWVTGGLPIEGVRKVPIPLQENGYGRIDAQVIDSQKELDSLLAEVKQQQEAWTKPDVFVKAMADAKVDFTKEVLVLIRNSEGSGPVDVYFRLAQER